MILNRFGRRCGFALAVSVLALVGGDTFRAASAADEIPSTVTLYNLSNGTQATKFAFAVVRQPNHAELVYCKGDMYRGDAANADQVLAFFHQACTQPMRTYADADYMNSGAIRKHYVAPTRLIVTSIYSSSPDEGMVHSGVDTYIVDLYSGAVPADSILLHQGAQTQLNGMTNPTLNTYHATYVLVGQAPMNYQPIQD